MREAAERPQRLDGGLGRDAERERRGEGRERVLHVVRARQREVRPLREDPRTLACHVREKEVVGEPGAHARRMAPREREAPRARPDARDERVVCVQHGDLRLALIFEDPRFGRAVVVHRPVAVEVVGCEVQEHRHVGRERRTSSSWKDDSSTTHVRGAVAFPIAPSLVAK